MSIKRMLFDIVQFTLARPMKRYELLSKWFSINK